MQATTVKFRGRLSEVLYEDMGHEPHCNSHVIEWSFVYGPYNSLCLTDAEEQSIYDQLKEWVDATPDGWP
jgi:hypothetical protein